MTVSEEHGCAFARVYTAERVYLSSGGQLLMKWPACAKMKAVLRKVCTSDCVHACVRVCVFLSEFGEARAPVHLSRVLK